MDDQMFLGCPISGKKVKHFFEYEDKKYVLYDQFITLAWKDHKLNYVDKIGPDKDYYLKGIPKLPLSSDKCKGYTERWNKHKSYFFKKYNNQK